MRGKVTCQQCHISVKQGKKESVAASRLPVQHVTARKYQTLVDDWIAQNKNIRQGCSSRDKLTANEKRYGCY